MNSNSDSRERLRQRHTPSSTSAASSTKSSTLSPFQTHLSFFASARSPTVITLASALKSSLKLGLNFPVSLFLAVALRILYAEFPYYWRPVDIERIPRNKWRTQLQGTTIDADSHPQGFTITELLQITNRRENSGAKGLAKKLIDQGHVVGFWAMAADVHTRRVSLEDLKRFQTGTWNDAVAARRRFRDGKEADVLPFTRGGPLSVAGHSWAVGRFLGVRVYESGRNKASS